MAQPTVVDILRELLVVEQRSLPARLIESTVFVSELAVDDLNAITAMARAGQEHGAQLAELILSLGGVPGLRGTDMSSADLHYQAVEYVLPRLAQDRESLVRLYGQAVERVTDEPGAAELLRGILSCHQEELRRIQQLSDKRLSPAD